MLKTIPSINTYYQNKALALNEVGAFAQIKQELLTSSFTKRYLRIQNPLAKLSQIKVFDMKGNDQTSFVRSVQVSSETIDIAIYYRGDSIFSL